MITAVTVATLHTTCCHRLGVDEAYCLCVVDTVLFNIAHKVIVVMLHHCS